LNPASKIPTPNLDRLARGGAIFTDAHSPSAVCTHTRYGVVTGRYCWRSRLKRGVLNGYSEHLIDPERETIASFLTKNGYRTGIVGKWHLGLDFAKGENTRFDFTKPVRFTPNANGFGESYIIPASLDFPPYVYIHNDRITHPPKQIQPAKKFPKFLRKGEIASDLAMEDVLDHLAEKAAGFIAESARGDKPFFLYVPWTSPHKPVWPHTRFKGRTKLGPYGDFIVNTDDAIGKVLDALDQAGVADNTLVFYTSDNGSFMYRYEETEPDHLDDETLQGYKASNHTANGPLRGTKADIWEAGHRVPFFVRWPARIKPGTTSGKTICHVDFLATCADAIGRSVPAGVGEDSHSFLPAAEGKPPASKRPPVINHSAAGMFAIRDGTWKLVLGNGSGGRQKPKGKPFQKPYHLFDLEKDLAETTNLIEQFPEVADRLIKAFEEVRGE
ncbi:MAG: arylsulfatase, partial [Verrucomicrobiota bacterium]